MKEDIITIAEEEIRIFERPSKKSSLILIEELKAANQKLSVLENNALLTQLKHAIMKIPTRIEPIGGQNYKYIRLEEVLDTLQK